MHRFDGCHVLFGAVERRAERSIDCGVFTATRNSFSGFADARILRSRPRREFFVTRKHARPFRCWQSMRKETESIYMRLRSVLKSVAVASVLAGVAAGGTSPASARTLRDQVLPQDPPVYVPDTARDAAIHDCSVAASKWVFSTWQSTQITRYRDCMTEHGQMEE